MRRADVAESIQAGLRAACPVRSPPLGELADRAAFAPDELPADVADSAWRIGDELCRTLRAGLSRPHRIRAAFDPRPLLARRS